MKKLIDLSKEIAKDLNKMAIDAGKDLKTLPTLSQLKSKYTL